MVDPVIVVSMVFVVILVLLVGGFVVTYPVTRRLGKALEVYLEERSRNLPDADRIEDLGRAVRSLRDEVRALSEKQEFVEKLLKDENP